MKFSAVIITLNVARTLRDCLAALQQVTDDIVVLDSHSTDGTVDICREMGVRLVPQKWLGYAATKNHGNTLARHDWVLSIDADEVLSPELIATLQQLRPQPGRVYALDRLTSYCGQFIRHSGWYPDWKPRLFDRRQVCWQGDFVHETLAVPPDFRVEKLAGKLLHFSFHSVEEHRQRAAKYARLAAAEQFAAGKKATFVKRHLSPLARFVRTYFLKLGLLDGRAGLTISQQDYRMVRLRYRLLHDLWQEAADPPGPATPPT